MLNTVWNDDGEGIFDENWFGVLFGAAAGWQAGESSEDAFTASYGIAFHGDATGKINQAQQALMAAHALLKKADLGDARDSYFWVDPFSPPGQRIAEKIRPVLPELRMDAERAITLLAEARAAGKLENQEALDALELGARRIDFVGLKFQAADDCMSLYDQARQLAGSKDKSRRGEVPELLYTIGSNNGRLRTFATATRFCAILQAGVVTRQPPLLATDQHGPLRPVRAAMDCPRRQLADQGHPAVARDAYAAYARGGGLPAGPQKPPEKLPRSPGMVAEGIEAMRDSEQQLADGAMNEDGSPVAADVDPEQLARMRERFDALRGKIADAYADVPIEEGMAEIDAAVASKGGAETEPRSLLRWMQIRVVA